VRNTLSLILLYSLLCSTPGYATQYENNQYVWNFQSGEPWPGGYHQNTGKPKNLTWAYPEYPRDFFTRIANALPEQRVNEAFLTDDAGSNIHLNEEAEVFVTFVHEGAGYKNSFGYFTFDRANPPTSAAQVQEVIVFPNLSYPHLTNGHRVSLGTFPAGTSIGFFIAANGFWYDSGVRNTKVPYYYSLKDLNPDPTDELRQHNVLLFDEEVDEIVLGFEDLPRSWGDNDFNDAVFAVGATPSSAIDTEVLTPVPDANDSDADGVIDSEDEFPDNYHRASSSYSPSSNDYNTWAFEDNWPRRGDHDMNDLVVSEQSRVLYNAEGGVTGLLVEGFIEARGAAFANGFALRLPGVAAAAFADATITIAGQTYTKQPESGHDELVMQLWRNTHHFTTTGQTGRCSHFNTVKACQQFDPVPYLLEINFADPLAALDAATFDFFLFRTHYRGREIHLVDVAPTARFDLTQLGKFDDTSSVAEGRYFRTQENLPWALKIGTRWRYPQEYIDVHWAYPDYEAWVESEGAQATDWFNTSERDTHYY